MFYYAFLKLALTQYLIFLTTLKSAKHDQLLLSYYINLIHIEVSQGVSTAIVITSLKLNQ